MAMASAQQPYIPHPGLSVSGKESTLQWTVTAGKPVSYGVKFSPGLLDPADDTLARAGEGTGRRAGPRRRLVVVDSTVSSLHGDAVATYFAAQGVEFEICVIEAHEQTKNMESVFEVAKAMDRFGISRRHEPLIAIGGGVLTDIVGLAASMFRRSTPYVRVPTTLIGMVDAGIGAKTGVNFGSHKNRLGSYHPSEVTLIDPVFLRTLDVRHLSNGLGEILKIAMVKDSVLFELLARHGRRLVAERFQQEGSADGGRAAVEVLQRAIHGMLEELQPDLWEGNLRRLMDFGHSFSPTLEMEALPDLLHGEAVTIDMAFSMLIARRRGTVRPDQYRRVIDVARDLGLPVWHAACTPELMARALSDTVRHRDGDQHLPLPVGIGDACFIDDLTDSELSEAVGEFSAEHDPTTGRDLDLVLLGSSQDV